VIDQLDKKPAVMGHSTGGLLTQMIADRGLSAASVAIDPGPFRGVLPLPVSALKSASPVLRNPLNRGRAITLTFDQFKYGWANALDDREARHLYDTYHVAGPGVALAQMANANVNPFTEAKVDPRNPDVTARRRACRTRHGQNRRHHRNTLSRWPCRCRACRPAFPGRHRDRYVNELTAHVRAWRRRRLLVPP
jgi:pimeloyl-ACP methyl ester carboxylesterase